MKKFLLINTSLHIAVINTTTDQLAEQIRDSIPASSWIECDELPTCADIDGSDDQTPLNLLDYTIEDGQLVPVTEAILAARACELERAALWDEQERLKRALARTDHKTLQFAEGDISEADFAPIRATREAQRTRIREIAAILAAK